MSEGTAAWLLLASGVFWHLAIIAYAYLLSPTLSVDLDEEYRRP
jgi:hypothetical protein